MHDTDSITKDYMKDAATFADAFIPTSTSNQARITV